MSKLGWVCDFETLVNPNYTYIWAFGCCEIENPDNVIIGNTMEKYIEWVKTKGKIYFHNLAFDGGFIMDWLFRNGFTYSDERATKTFNILKSEGRLYQIDITWKYKNKKKFSHTVFLDSYKKLPYKVSKIAKDWKLPILKGEIDYKKHREYNHQITEKEKAYIKNDVQIVAMALKSMLESGFNKMTIGADALNYFKKTKPNEILSMLMPKISLELDEYFRKSYKGGWVFANPVYQGKDVGKGLVLDVNSLYPSRMFYKPMPYGVPVHYDGKYKPNKAYPLYICHIKANLELKKKHLPCLQLKNNPSFVATEYITDTHDEQVDLYLSSVDYELMKDQYNILSCDYIDGYMFQSCQGVFDDYINHFMEIKKNATGAKRQEAKLFLNNLYGKLATNPIKLSQMAFFDYKKDCVRYKEGKTDVKEPMYIPMGIFITAWARDLTIRSAQALYPRFCYADTDSLHLTGWDMPNNIEIHDKDLGKWALENKFTRARFLRAKTYIEEVDGKLMVTCAGLQKTQHEQVTWENFKSGEEYTKKLRPKTLKGGIVLEETTFKIS